MSIILFSNFNTLSASFWFPNLSQMIRFPAAPFSANLFTRKSVIPASLLLKVQHEVSEHFCSQQWSGHTALQT